ncbi:protein-tyrosine-phosphatase OS=Lysinibacillus sphaericus OX=1421 GN=LS41612_02145 PE=3 SV=1 [Lysinibacillus sphaericus]
MDVPDPYYTGDFQETYNLVLEGCQALLEKIKFDNKL